MKAYIFPATTTEGFLTFLILTNLVIFILCGLAYPNEQTYHAKLEEDAIDEEKDKSALFWKLLQIYNLVLLFIIVCLLAVMVMSEEDINYEVWTSFILVAVLANLVLPLVTLIFRKKESAKEGVNI